MTVWTEMAAEIKKILDGAGFTAMGEYTSADSLLHSGEAIGFYGLKGYDVVDEVIGQGGKKLYTEYICHIDLRLMGKLIMVGVACLLSERDLLPSPLSGK